MVMSSFKIFKNFIYIYIYIYIYVYTHIYKLDWKGIQYNILDTTNSMLGNLQSIFLPIKTKRVYK